MKIRCRKCGKKFDADVYSGLCPKCGAYNGKQRDDSEISAYIKTSDQAGELHRKLHDTYDEGYAAAHSRTEQTVSEQGKAGRESGKAFRWPDDGKDFQRQQAMKQPSQKSRAHLVFLVFAVPVAVLVIPLFFGLVNLEWKREYLQKSIQTEHTVEKAGWESGMVLDGEYLEAPVKLTFLEGGMVEIQAKMPPGVSLYGIRMGAYSEEYSFEGRLDEIYLTYETEGNVYYKSPLDSYSMKEYLMSLGLTEDDLLYSYGLGNGIAEEGYLFFLADEQATHIGLLIQAHGGEEPLTVFAEGRIDLDGIPELNFGSKSGEVE